MAATMTKDWFIILNPVAGGGKATKYWPEMKQLFLSNGFDFEMAQTTGKGDAIELAKKAVLAGYKKIIAIGGDGTNNEAVNGIFSQSKIPTQHILYTLIPVGTGNDWIKTYNISKNFRKWIPLIKKLKTRKQDLGLVSYHYNGEKKERYFVNVAGMAYDGYIGKISTEKKGPTVSKFIYLSLIVSQLFKYKNRKAAVIFNGQEFESEFYSVNVGICRYSGGGMQLVPHAIPDDGLLALSYDTGVSKLGVLTMTPRLFTGSLGKHKKVKTHQVKMVRVEARENRSTYLEADGEFLGETPCEFYILDNVLNVIIP